MINNKRKKEHSFVRESALTEFKVAKLHLDDELEQLRNRSEKKRNE